MINLLEEEPVHIAGVLVKAFPQNTQAIAQKLNALPGTEVHEITDDGSMVVTVEATDTSTNEAEVLISTSPSAKT